MTQTPARVTTKVIGKLPFAGRNYVRTVLADGLRAAHQGDVRGAKVQENDLQNQAVGHFFAAFLGGIVVAANAVNTARHGGVLFPVETTYNTLFTLVNVGCGYVHTRMANAVTAANERINGPLSPAAQQPLKQYEIYEAESSDVPVPTIGQRITNTAGYTAMALSAAHAIAGTVIPHLPTL